MIMTKLGTCLHETPVMCKEIVVNIWAIVVTTWNICYVGMTRSRMIRILIMYSKFLSTIHMWLFDFVMWQPIISLWPNDAIWWHTGSGNNDLLPDGTKPLPEPMLTYLQQGPVTFSWGHFNEIVHPSITKISLKITCLKFYSNLPGANELSTDWLFESIISSLALATMGILLLNWLTIVQFLWLPWMRWVTNYLTMVSW